MRRNRTVVRVGARILLAVILLWLALLVRPLMAQSPIQVLNMGHQYVFSERLDFSIEVQSTSDITELVVFYTQGHDSTTSRAYPNYSPAKQVKTTVTDKIARGQIPPGSEITYYWRIKDADGNTFKTEKQHFTYMDNRFEWKSESKEQVVFYWYGLSDNQASHLLDVSVKALDRLAQTIGVSLKQPVKIFAYQSKADMQKAQISRGSTFEGQITTLGTVVAPDTMLLLATDSNVELTISHELTHVVVGLATDNPYSDLPAWLNEGLAMYNEGKLRGGNKSSLEQAKRNDTLLSVRSMTSPTGQPDLVNQWYGQAYSIVQYLLETYGKDKMSQLLTVFKEGILPDDALQQVYGFNQDDLDVKWRAWLGAPPRKGSTAPVTPTIAKRATRSPASTPRPAATAASKPTPTPAATRNPLTGLCCLTTLFGGAAFGLFWFFRSMYV
ncbi:MAG: hypothetical protein GXP41_12575 [Chloroflexi bacterium]|nr:hypothetical protein [Chloroflexota bacterium]